MAIKRVEPTNLNSATLSTTVNKNYRDVDLSFAHKNGTVFEDGIRRGDVYKKVDIRAVEQSMKNILLTNHFEKPFQPDFGADLRRLLFELDTMVSEPQVRDLITRSISRWEPRVEIDKIELLLPGDNMVPKGTSDIFFYAAKSGTEAHTLSVVIYANIKNTGQEIVTRVNMNRLR
jgi:phage baseplate assembly protein W